MAAGEKTEEATPRRRQEARKKGQVAKSVEINSAFVLIGGLLVLQLFGPGIYEQLLQLVRETLATLPRADLTMADTRQLGFTLGISFLKIMSPVFAAALMIGVVSNVAQMGFVFSFDQVKPKFSRMNPLQGFKRLLSKRSLVEVLKGVLKITVVSVLVYMVFQDKAALLLDLTRMGVLPAFGVMAGIGLELAFKAAAIIFVMAAGDFVFQRREFIKNLRMTRHEVKEEWKQAEGSPQLKARIRQVQRQMAASRMMHSVPQASVVITNPTHLAVALQYDSKTMRSPKVTAKGERLMAERIKEVAREHGVPIVENKPLAQALYKAVDIGMDIPGHLYQAVAEVLAYIYGLRGRAHGG